MDDRWNSLCSRLGAPGDSAAWFPILESLHAVPVRAYHNLVHVRDCLDLFQTVRDAAASPEQIEFSIWFHDCVYVPGRPDNVEKSAAVARIAAASMSLSPGWGDEITRLILATRHKDPPHSPDGAILVDVDMSILAAPADTYDRYAAAIRAEFAFVPDEQFAAGRGAFLKGLLARGAIFHSGVLAARFEAPARRNVERELARLSG